MSINKKVSELTAASALTGTELFYGDDGTNDVKVTAEQIRTYAAADSGLVHIAGEEDITGVKIFADGSLRTQNTGDSSFDMGLHSTGTLTADRELNVNLNDADRTLTMTGNLTMSGAFNLTWTITADTSVTLPTTGTLATLAGSEALTNKTLGNTNTFTARSDRFTQQDSADTTKQLTHVLSGITTATTRTATWPDANITVTGIAATQTLSNKTLDNSNIYTTRSDRFTLQDSSDTTKQLTHVLSSIATGTTRTATWPNANITVAGTATTQTLTNKTINLANNTLTGTTAEFNAALSDADFTTATTPTTFTPTVTLVGGAGNTVPVYTTNTGRYTQIASRVFVDVLLDGDGGAEGAGTGVINIALPVAVNASFPQTAFPGGQGRNGGSEYILFVEPSGSTVSVNYFDAIGNRAGFTGDLQNNTTRAIRLAFSYEA